VYDANYDFVWRSLRALGVAHAWLDDATQDVFIVVHRRLPTFDGAAPVRAWIYGVARNVAHKYRGRATAAGSASAPALQLLDAAAPAPAEALAIRERAELVRDFLESLGPEQREVFVLHQLEGMTAPEIAAALGLKLNTAYSRLRLARRRFERAIARAQKRGNRG
jgi:RNA polymerase sigma-70 factor (ECF subfamily)